MKGLITAFLSCLMALPLLPDHPFWYVAVVTLLMIVVLTFWCGAVTLTWKSRK